MADSVLFHFSQDADKMVDGIQAALARLHRTLGENFTIPGGQFEGFEADLDAVLARSRQKYSRAAQEFARVGTTQGGRTHTKITVDSYEGARQDVQALAGKYGLTREDAKKLVSDVMGPFLAGLKAEAQAVVGNVRNSPLVDDRAYGSGTIQISPSQRNREEKAYQDGLSRRESTNRTQSAQLASQERTGARITDNLDATARATAETRKAAEDEARNSADRARRAGQANAQPRENGRFVGQGTPPAGGLTPAQAYANTPAGRANLARIQELKDAREAARREAIDKASRERRADDEAYRMRPALPGPVAPARPLSKAPEGPLDPLDAVAYLSEGARSRLGNGLQRAARFQRLPGDMADIVEQFGVSSTKPTPNYVVPFTFNPDHGAGISTEDWRSQVGLLRQLTSVGAVAPPAAAPPPPPPPPPPAPPRRPDPAPGPDPEDFNRERTLHGRLLRSLQGLVVSREQEAATVASIARSAVGEESAAREAAASTKEAAASAREAAAAAAKEAKTARSLANRKTLDIKKQDDGTYATEGGAYRIRPNPEKGLGKAKYLLHEDVEGSTPTKFATLADAKEGLRSAERLRRKMNADAAEDRAQRAQGALRALQVEGRLSPDVLATRRASQGVADATESVAQQVQAESKVVAETVSARQRILNLARTVLAQKQQEAEAEAQRASREASAAKPPARPTQPAAAVEEVTLDPAKIAAERARVADRLRSSTPAKFTKQDDGSYSSDEGYLIRRNPERGLGKAKYLLSNPDDDSITKHVTLADAKAAAGRHRSDDGPAADLRAAQAALGALQDAHDAAAVAAHNQERVAQASDEQAGVVEETTALNKRVLTGTRKVLSRLEQQAAGATPQAAAESAQPQAEKVTTPRRRRAPKPKEPDADAVATDEEAPPKEDITRRIRNRRKPPTPPGGSGGFGGDGAGAGGGGGDDSGDDGGASRRRARRIPTLSLFDGNDDLRRQFREISRGRYQELASGKYLKDADRAAGTGRYITGRAELYEAKRDDLSLNGGRAATDSSIERLQRAIELFDTQAVNGLADGVRRIGRNLFEDARSGATQYVRTDRRGARVLDSGEEISFARAAAERTNRMSEAADRRTQQAANARRLQDAIDPATGGLRSDLESVGGNFLKNATGEYFQKVGKQLVDLADLPFSRKLAQDQEAKFRKEQARTAERDTNRDRLSQAIDPGTGRLDASRYEDIGGNFLRDLTSATDHYFQKVGHQLVDLADQPYASSLARTQEDKFREAQVSAAEKKANQERLADSVHPLTGRLDTSRYEDIGGNFVRDVASGTDHYFQKVGQELRDLADRPHTSSLARIQEDKFRESQVSAAQKQANEQRLQDVVHPFTGKLDVSRYEDIGGGFLRDLTSATDHYFQKVGQQLVDLSDRPYAKSLARTQEDKFRESQVSAAQQQANEQRLRDAVHPLTGSLDASRYQDLGGGFIRDLASGTEHYFQRVGKELRDLADQPYTTSLARTQENKFRDAQTKQREREANERRLSEAIDPSTGKLDKARYEDVGGNFLRDLTSATDHYFQRVGKELRDLGDQPFASSLARDQEARFREASNRASQREANEQRLRSAVDPRTGVLDTSRYEDIGGGYLRDLQSVTDHYFKRVGQQLLDLADEPFASSLARQQDDKFHDAQIEQGRRDAARGKREADEARLRYAVDPTTGKLDTSRFEDIGAGFLRDVRSATDHYFKRVGKGLQDLADEPFTANLARQQEDKFREAQAGDRKREAAQRKREADEQRLANAVDPRTGDLDTTRYEDIGGGYLRDVQSATEHYFKRVGQELRDLADEPFATNLARQQEDKYRDTQVSTRQRKLNEQRLNQAVDPATGTLDATRYEDLGGGYLRDVASATDHYFQKVGQQLLDLANRPYAASLARLQEDKFREAQANTRNRRANEDRLSQAVDPSTGKLDKARYQDVGGNFLRDLTSATDHYFQKVGKELRDLADQPYASSLARQQEDKFREAQSNTRRREANEQRLRDAVNPSTGRLDDSRYEDLGRGFLRDLGSATDHYFQKVGQELRDLSDQPYASSLARQQEDKFREAQIGTVERKANEARLANAVDPATGKLDKSRYEDLGGGYLRDLTSATDHYFQKVGQQLVDLAGRPYTTTLARAQEDKFRKAQASTQERQANEKRLTESIDPATGKLDVAKYEDLGRGFMRDLTSATDHYFQKVGRELRDLADQPFVHNLARTQEDKFREAQERENAQKANRQALQDAYDPTTEELSPEFQRIARNLVRRLSIAGDEFFEIINGELRSITGNRHKVSQAQDSLTAFNRRNAADAQKSGDRQALQDAYDPATDELSPEFQRIGKNLVRRLSIAGDEFFEIISGQLRSITGDRHKVSQAQDALTAFNRKNAADAEKLANTQALQNAFDPATDQLSPEFQRIAKNLVRRLTIAGDEFFEIVNGQLRSIMGDRRKVADAQDTLTAFNQKNAVNNQKSTNAQALQDAYDPATDQLSPEFQRIATNLVRRLSIAGDEFFEIINGQLRSIAGDRHKVAGAQDALTAFNRKNAADAERLANSQALQEAYDPATDQLSPEFQRIAKNLVRRLSIAGDEFFEIINGELRSIMGDRHKVSDAQNAVAAFNRKNSAEAQKASNRDRLAAAYVGPGQLREDYTDLGSGYLRQQLNDQTREYFRRVGDELKAVPIEQMGAALRAEQQAKARQSIGGNFLTGLLSGGFGGEGAEGLGGLAKAAGTTVKYTALYGALGLVQQGFRQLGTEMLNFEDSRTNLDVALESMGASAGDAAKDTDNLTRGLQDIAIVAGSNVGDTMDIASVGIRAFGDEVKGAGGDVEQFGITFAREAQRLAVLANTTVTDAGGNLRAAISGFGLGPNSVQRLMDATVNAKQFGGDPEDISQGLASFAEGAGAAGITPELAAALVSRVTAATDRDGQAVGTSLTRLLSITGGTSGQAALERVNQAIATQRTAAGQDAGTPAIDLKAQSGTQLQQLAKVYDQLSVSQQRLVTNQLAGTNSSREFSAALDFLANSSDVAKASLDQSVGKSGEEYQRRLGDLTAQVRKFVGQVRALLSTLSESGVLDPLVLAFGQLSGGLGAIDKLLQAFNSLPRSAREAVFAVIELTAAVKALEVLTAGGGIKNFLKDRGIGLSSRALTRGGGKTAEELGLSTMTAAEYRAQKIAGRLPSNVIYDEPGQQQYGALNYPNRLNIGGKLRGVGIRAQIAATDLNEWRRRDPQSVNPNYVPPPDPFGLRLKADLQRRQDLYMLQQGRRDTLDLIPPADLTGLKMGAKAVGGAFLKVATGLLDPYTAAIAGLIAIGAIKGKADEFNAALKEVTTASTDFAAAKTPDDLKNFISEGANSRRDLGQTQKGFFGRLVNGERDTSDVDVLNQQIRLAKQQVSEQENAAKAAAKTGTAISKLAAFGDPAALSVDTITAGLDQLTASGASATERLALLQKVITGLNADGSAAAANVNKVRVAQAGIRAINLLEKRPDVQDDVTVAAGADGAYEDQPRRITNPAKGLFANAAISDAAERAVQAALPDTTSNPGRVLTPAERKKAAQAGAKVFADAYRAQIAKIPGEVKGALSSKEVFDLAAAQFAYGLSGNVTDLVPTSGVLSPDEINLLASTIESTLSDEITLANGDPDLVNKAYQKAVDDLTKDIARAAPGSDTTAAQAALATLKANWVQHQISDAEAIRGALQANATSESEYRKLGEASLTASILLASQAGDVPDLITLFNEGGTGLIGRIRANVAGKLAAAKKKHKAAEKESTAEAAAKAEFGGTISEDEGEAYGKELKRLQGIGNAKGGSPEAIARAAAQKEGKNKFGNITSDNAQAYNAYVDKETKRLLALGKDKAGAATVSGLEKQLNTIDKALARSHPSPDDNGSAQYDPKFLQIALQRRNSSAAANAPLDAATRAANDAGDNLKALSTKDDNYWQTFAANTQAQQQLAQAQADAALNAKKLTIDLTNPVQEAKAELDAQKTASAKIIADASDPKNIGKGKGKLYVNQAAAQAAINAAKLAQQSSQDSYDDNVRQDYLTSLQNQDRLGAITHKQYLQGLQNEKTRVQQKLAGMNSLDEQYYALNQYLVTVSDAAKAAADELSGQFNLGDIRVPTVYEVRRAMKSRDSGSVLKSNSATSTAGNVVNDNSTSNVILNGVSMEKVIAVLKDQFGVTVKTSSSRKR